MTEACPYCDAPLVNTLSTPTGVRKLFDCYTIFLNGELYDKRNRKCYDRQLARKDELLRRAVEVMETIASPEGMCYYDVAKTTKEKANQLATDIEAELGRG